MTTMSISLPESMKNFIESQVAEGGYGTASEYFRELVRQAQKRKEQEKLETLLLEALDSPAAELTPEDFAGIKRRLLERYGRK